MNAEGIVPLSGPPGGKSLPVRQVKVPAAAKSCDGKNQGSSVGYHGLRIPGAVSNHSACALVLNV